ncbi:formimidoylglutamase [Christiangramia aquimixticola]|uniref:formimidoylglutamase n=1 Tax=Christiangramia aquimixticola TaxID=1697558 RepID=UPI003AA8F082
MEKRSKMEGVKFFNNTDLKKLTSSREGEQKFGEKISLISSEDQLRQSKVKYVLLGIPEDIGVRANYGKKGTSEAWTSFLKSFLNIQVNRYNDPSRIGILGPINCDLEMAQAGNIDEADPNYYQKLGDLVHKIDEKVSLTIDKIVSAEKIPVIIGGGHNNAYGNIKGTSTALNSALNVLNIDAHTDLRKLEHRHSGNGFNYALKENFLNKYAVFGLHKNYTPEYIFREMDNSECIQFIMAEDLFKKPTGIMSGFEKTLDWLGNENLGLEIDCDAMAYFPSSAKSPSGFSVEDVRKMIRTVAKLDNCKYLHLCEAAPSKENEGLVGKALSYFVSDFIA